MKAIITLFVLLAIGLVMSQMDVQVHDPVTVVGGGMLVGRSPMGIPDFESPLLVPPDQSDIIADRLVRFTGRNNVISIAGRDIALPENTYVEAHVGVDMTADCVIGGTCLAPPIYILRSTNLNASIDVSERTGEIVYAKESDLAAFQWLVYAIAGRREFYIKILIATLAVIVLSVPIGLRSVGISLTRK